MVLPEQLVIPENSPLKPIPYLVTERESGADCCGRGVKASADPADATVIWLKNSEEKVTFSHNQPLWRPGIDKLGR
ncbi:MAG: hypothetical protein MZV63_58200 [Marinilabiliales bacterium]|nr:hypothetical protein [Marinilabiliales bacterium]